MVTPSPFFFVFGRSTAAGGVERGKGWQRTSSSTLTSVNVPNALKSGASNFGDSLASALKQLSELQH